MIRRARSRLGGYPADTSGAAALEFVICLLVLVPAFMSIADLATYIYRGIQVGNAAQAAAQAVWTKCTTAPISGCTSIDTYVANGIQYGSALGTAVTEVSGQRHAEYYCPAWDTSSASYVMNANGASKSCSSGVTAGYYFKTRVTYTYLPIFPATSLVSLLPNPITRDVWIRIE